MASACSVQHVYARAVAPVLAFALLMAPHLNADTIVTFPLGTGPQGIAFDGTNIWVANGGNSSVTKLLAATGAVIGTYPVGNPQVSFDDPYGVVFDGSNIWVTNQGVGSANPGFGTVTKLRASTGEMVGTYPVAPYPWGIAFDGVNIWVAGGDSQGGAVTKLLASTGAMVGTYAVGTSPIGVAFDGASIWVTNYQFGTLTKLLASSGATMAHIPWEQALGASPSTGPISGWRMTAAAA